MNKTELYNGDCLEIMAELIKKNIKVDVIITDPPYEIKNTKAGGQSKLAKSIQGSNNEILKAGLTKGFDYIKIMDKMIKLQNKINIYIWCNKAQIPIYLNYFVIERKCSFDIIKWVKTNPVPTFYNKYLSDTEYCLYLKKGSYCMPSDFKDASTLYQAPINTKDKKLFNHPTIKPLPIIERLIRNSSKENEIILDPFMGSGTTGVACKNLNRNFIGIELNKKYFETAKNRINNHTTQLKLF